MSRLILPRRLGKSGTPHLGHYVGMSDLGEARSSVADLTRQLSKMRRSELLRVLAAISAWLSRDDGLSIQLQIGLANGHLESDLATKILHYHQTHSGLSWAIFHPRLVVFLTEFAVLACSEDVPCTDDIEFRHAFGKACLMGNDVLSRLEQSQFPEPDSQPTDEWYATILVPVMAHEVGIEAMARARLIWINSRDNAEVLRVANKIGVPHDFNSAFEAKYKVSLEEFMLVCLCLYGGYQKAVARLPISPLHMSPRQDFKSLFSEDTIKRVMALISIRPDELADEMLSQPRQSWALDHTTVAKYPLIEVLPDRYACISLSFLMRVFTDRIYWLLRDSYPEKSFSDLFGYVFEDYILKFLSRVTVPDNGAFLRRTLYWSPIFTGTQDQVCDGMIHWGDTAIMIESKASLITSRQRFATVIDDTMSGIATALAMFHPPGKGKGRKGAGQLAESIRRLTCGENASCGKSSVPGLSEVRRIIPALVVYDECFGSHAVRNIVDKRFREWLTEHGIDGSKVSSLIILTIDDIERLEEIAQKLSLEKLFLDYVTAIDQDPQKQIGNFYSYAASIMANTKIDRSTTLIGMTLQLVLDQAGEELTSRTADSPKAE